MNSTVKAGLVSLTIATLILGETIGDFTSVSNRFFWRWDPLDKWVILTLVLALTTVGFLGFLAVRATKNEKFQWVMWHVFLLLVFEGVFINLRGMRKWPVWLQLIEWALVFIFLAMSFRTPAWRVPQRAAFLALIFAAFPIIVLVQVFTWPAQTRLDPTAAAPAVAPVVAATQPAAGADLPFVLFLSFDALGWPPISTPDGEIIADLPNLKALSEQSWLFRNGSSPDRATRFSLPRMVFQTDAVFVTPGRKTREFGRSPVPGFNVSGEFTPTQKVDSIFTLARGAGYRTHLATFYMPWSNLLGDQADTVSEYPIDPKGYGYADRVRQLATISARYLSYPGARHADEYIERVQFSRNWADINLRMQAETLATIRDGAPNTFAFYHYPLPHPPFVFTADGQYAGPYRQGRTKEGTDEEYRNQLRFVDKFLGQVVAELKAAGRYDNSLIIVTADHGWFSAATRGKISNDLYKDRMKVPILIKGPKQTAPQRVDEVFANSRLRPIIDLAIRERELKPEATRELIQKFQGPSQSEIEKRLNESDEKLKPDDL